MDRGMYLVAYAFVPPQGGLSLASSEVSMIPPKNVDEVQNLTTDIHHSIRGAGVRRENVTVLSWSFLREMEPVAPRPERFREPLDIVADPNDNRSTQPKERFRGFSSDN